MKTSADIDQIIERQHFLRLEMLSPHYIQFLLQNDLVDHQVVGGGTPEKIVPYNFLGLPIAVHHLHPPCHECQYHKDKCSIKANCMAIRFFDSLKTGDEQSES